jgi:hypothetical protein
MIPNNTNIPNDAEMSEALYLHLKKQGLAFPDTQEELDHFLELVQQHKVDLPADLPSAADILSNGEMNMPSDLNSSTDSEIEENLSQAARDGRELSDELMRKLQADRKRTEESKKRKDDNT